MTRSRIDIDFSTALHNRTGKYFIGIDLIHALDERLGRTWYWRIARATAPAGLVARIVGRLQDIEVRSRTRFGTLGFLPRRRGHRRILHTDPFTVPTCTLGPDDIVLCHDVGPVTHPDLFEPQIGRVYRSIYDEIAAVGPHVVFVSRASRDAFAGLSPRADQSRWRVIYPALRFDRKDGAGRPVPGLDDATSFLLTVGSIGSRKNQRRTIAAFHRSGLAARGVRYVLCGASEPGAEQVLAAANATPGVLLLPYVDDAQLRWLYANARAFVLASLLEGFGIPVAEAMAHGLVPIVSRDSVLEEVAGPQALLVDPLDTAVIADAMIAAVDMDDAERHGRVRGLRTMLDRFGIGDFTAAWRAMLDELDEADDGHAQPFAAIPDAPRLIPSDQK